MFLGPAARRIVLAAWLVSIMVIVHLSLQPGIEMPVSFWNADKVYHFLAYGWLGALPVWGFASRGRGRLAAASMVVLGLLLEWGQSFLPSREASLADGAANAVGVLLGVWLSGRLLERVTAWRAS